MERVAGAPDPWQLTRCGAPCLILKTSLETVRRPRKLAVPPESTSTWQREAESKGRSAKGGGVKGGSMHAMLHTSYARAQFNRRHSNGCIPEQRG